MSFSYFKFSATLTMVSNKLSNTSATNKALVVLSCLTSHLSSFPYRSFVPEIALAGNSLLARCLFLFLGLLQLSNHYSSLDLPSPSAITDTSPSEII